MALINATTHINIIYALFQLWALGVVSWVAYNISGSYMRDHNGLISSVVWWLITVACWCRIAYLLVWLIMAANGGVA